MPGLSYRCGERAPLTPCHPSVPRGVLFGAAPGRWSSVKALLYIYERGASREVREAARRSRWLLVQKERSMCWCQKDTGLADLWHHPGSGCARLLTMVLSTSGWCFLLHDRGVPLPLRNMSFPHPLVYTTASEFGSSATDDRALPRAGAVFCGLRPPCHQIQLNSQI